MPFSMSAIIWGFTPSMMKRAPAASSLTPQAQPSRSARRWAFSFVRLARRMRFGSTAFAAALASAPPMLPVPIKPYS